MIKFKINGKATRYEGDGNRPLLWYLRDTLNMTGTRFGCGVAILARNPKPDDSAIDQAMQGNLCRCATYHRIRAAIHEAASTLAKEV